MKITVAKTAGFCFGVNRAVNMALDAAKNNGADNISQVFTYGELIHNRQCVEMLRNSGITVIESAADIKNGDTVILRSHGVPSHIFEELKSAGAKIIDATCPYVSKIHKIVKESAESGQSIFIIGEAAHPEIVGIKSFGKNDCKIFANAKEMGVYFENGGKISDKGCCLVAQTTLNTEVWKKCVEFLKNICTNAIISDTICKTTYERQAEAMKLATESDAVCVIGGKNSSNTAKLYDICKALCKNTYQIETAEDLKNCVLDSGSSVAITAGASTPDHIIKEVINTMTEMEKNLEGEFDFAAALDETFKTLNNGDRVMGMVCEIANNEIRVDLGTKYSGFVPFGELTDDATAKLSDLYKIGDELELFIVRVNDVEGTIMCSKKKIDSFKFWDEINESVDNGKIFEGVVTEVVKGGVIVSYNGVRVFVPASMATVSRDESYETMLKQTVRFRITEINRQRRRIIGSIKSVAIEARKEAEMKVLENLTVGTKYTGTVKSIMPFGAFVDIGGIDGLVHISELSWKRIKTPTDVVNIGDTVEVYIKEYDAEKKRISLGYKDISQNPWELIKQHQIGDVVNVTVVKFMTFGAFAEIIPGVDGLIYISQIANARVERIQDYLKIGQKVDAKIIDINYETKKIGLSVRALLEPDSADIPHEHQTDFNNPSDVEKETLDAAENNEQYQSAANAENTETADDTAPKADTAE